MKKGEIYINKEQICLWLSMVEDMNYYSLLNLLKAFSSIDELYTTTKNKDKLIKRLYSNNIVISNKMFYSLIDINLKRRLNNVYLNLISKRLKFVSIFSDKYPKELKNCIDAPILIVYYGNIELLNSNKKKIFVYNDSIENKLLNNLESFVNKNQNIIHINSKHNSSINVIYNKDLFEENSIIDVKHCNKDKLYILASKKEIKSMMISLLADVMLVIRAAFNKEIFIISSLMLEFGKEILVVPGEIYMRDTYFSNYLLREGATVILCKKDIEYYLSNL